MDHASCELCGLAQDEPHRVVHADAMTVTVVNVEPVKRGHVMVLPQRHAEDLADLSPEEAAAFLAAVDRCIRALARLGDEAPVCIVNGHAHRTQKHLHAHILPSRQGLRGLFSASEGTAERVRLDAEALREMTEEIKCAFDSHAP